MATFYIAVYFLGIFHCENWNMLNGVSFDREFIEESEKFLACCWHHSGLTLNLFYCTLLLHFTPSWAISRPSGALLPKFRTAMRA